MCPFPLLNSSFLRDDSSQVKVLLFKMFTVKAMMLSQNSRFPDTESFQSRVASLGQERIDFSHLFFLQYEMIAILFQNHLGGWRFLLFLIDFKSTAHSPFCPFHSCPSAGTKATRLERVAKVPGPEVAQEDLAKGSLLPGSPVALHRPLRTSHAVYSSVLPWLKRRP